METAQPDFMATDLQYGDPGGMKNSLIWPQALSLRVQRPAR